MNKVNAGFPDNGHNQGGIVATVSQRSSWSQDAEVVELMDLEPDNIHIGEYWLQLLPKEVLQATLHKAMVEAKARLELRRTGGA